MKDKVKMQQFKLMMQGSLVGVLAGIVAIIYRLMLSYAQSFVDFMADLIHNNYFWIVVWVILGIIVAFVVAWILKKESMSSGSGIPQLEGEMQGALDQNWKRVLPAKMIGGSLCSLMGLSLGREGPSIQLGAMVGKGVAKKTTAFKQEEKFLLTCGAAAGLSAAFNAPLAGVLFALEEIHKNFSVSVLVSVICASVCGDFVSKIVFGFDPSFHFALSETIPLSQYYLLILLGIVCAIAAIIYNKTTLLAQDLYAKITWIPNHYKVIVPILVGAILIVFCPLVLGGGHGMVELLYEPAKISLTTIAILLGLKFLYSMISFASGAIGGIFFPLLVLGSFVGALFAKAIGVEELYFNNYVVFAMAAFFSGIVRAPITGIVLISEMCGSLQFFLPITLVSIISYVICNALNCEPIYESLLHRILKKQNKLHEEVEDKHIIREFVVQLSSDACNQCIKDIVWPNNILITSVIRGQKKLMPKGSLMLLTGDIIRVKIEKSKQQKLAKQIEKITS